MILSNLVYAALFLGLCNKLNSCTRSKFEAAFVFWEYYLSNIKYSKYKSNRSIFLRKFSSRTSPYFLQTLYPINCIPGYIELLMNFLLCDQHFRYQPVSALSAPTKSVDLFGYLPNPCQYSISISLENIKKLWFF